MENIKKRELLGIVLHILIYGFLVVFFTRISPLIAYDVDDWVFLGDFGNLLPKWKAWNPTRIFCTNIMPLGGRLGALLYPVTGDYVRAVTLSSALILSAFITVMCYLYLQMVLKRISMPLWKGLISEGVFLASFFLIFRNRPSSSFMFHAADLCCVYFYVMSGILNGCIVLYMMRFEDFAKAFKELSLPVKIVFLAALYFAVFSNLFHSAITIVYCGAVVLYSMLQSVGKDSILSIIKKNYFYIAIILLWLLVLLFEKSGGRAGSFGEPFDITVSISQLIAMIKAISVPYMIVIVVSIVYLAVTAIKRKKMSTEIIVSAVSLVLITVYLILLTALIHYFSRIEASWGTWFFLILICSMSLGQMIAGVKDPGQVREKVVPVSILAIMVVACILPDGKYRISSDRNTDYDSCYKGSSYLTGHIIEADRNGEYAITLPIPKAVNPDDFTYQEGIGNTISHTLYVQGVIDREISVTEIVDEKLNSELLTP